MNRANRLKASKKEYTREKKDVESGKGGRRNKGKGRRREGNTGKEEATEQS